MHIHGRGILSRKSVLGETIRPHVGVVQHAAVRLLHRQCPDPGKAGEAHLAKQELVPGF